MLHRQAVLCTSCDLAHQRRQIAITACLVLARWGAQSRSLPARKTQRCKGACIAHHDATHQVPQPLTVYRLAWLAGRHVNRPELLLGPEDAWLEQSQEIVEFKQ